MGSRNNGDQMSSVSIVMTSYKRPEQLRRTLHSISIQTRRPDQIVVVEDGGDEETRGICAVACMQKGLKVEYCERRNRPKLDYSNPAIPKNIGIKKAIGDILIIQCAEVRYTNPQDIERLVKPVEEDPSISNIAQVKALGRYDNFQEWYAGPERAPGWFLDFCQAVRRDKVMAINGFDELYEGYGFDDDDFALRLQASGVKYQWAMDVVCEHQWHFVPDKSTNLSDRGRIRYNMMKEAIDAGRRSPVANADRPWGIDQ
jgi:glycosyltransferase involved in cell wall biosynthesis